MMEKSHKFNVKQTGGQSEMKIKNPMMCTDMPDPDILRVGETWYMVSTTMFYMPGGPILRSKDLCHWEIVSYLFECLEENDGYELRNGQNAYGKGQWATSLAWKDGYYHAAFVCNDLNRTYFCRSRDIEMSEWERTWTEGIYHDMSFLFWEGRSYLVYGNGEIRIIELQEDLMGVKPETDRLLLSTDSENMRLRCEGCRAYVKNGFFYLLFIDWPQEGFDGGRRREICYRGRSLDGPFERRVLLNDDQGRTGCGIAQGALTDTPSGEWYAVMFQDRGAVGRIPYLVPVRWKDNWPVSEWDRNVSQTVELPWDEVSAAPLVISDSFLHRENRLLLQWQWNHNGHPDEWSFTERPGYLRIHNMQKAAGLLDAQNTLTQRTVEPFCSFSVELDAEGQAEGDFAGICALQGYFAQIGLTRDKNGWSLLAISRRLDGTMEETRQMVERSRIFLKEEFSFSEHRDEVRRSYSYDGKSWTPFGETVQLRFTLDIFVGCRVGLFSYATQNTGGRADFRDFCFSTENVE